MTSGVYVRVKKWKQTAEHTFFGRLNHINARTNNNIFTVSAVRNHYLFNAFGWE